ncbi:Hypothetical predicted protein [Pelobates cultripes]|uniref:Uncharacterized protein n=1 Tax=Pelobates cultripes TaxID=61616 RepID=A0AAD1RGF2_PELCU|nr:Hypothetical predicted protein [Pelobates cultripes]
MGEGGVKSTLTKHDAFPLFRPLPPSPTPPSICKPGPPTVRVFHVEPCQGFEHSDIVCMECGSDNTCQEAFPTLFRSQPPSESYPSGQVVIEGAIKGAKYRRNFLWDLSSLT